MTTTTGPCNCILCGDSLYTEYEILKEEFDGRQLCWACEQTIKDTARAEPLTVHQLQKLNIGRATIRLLSSRSGKLLCAEYSDEKHREKFGDREVRAVWPGVDVPKTRPQDYWCLSGLFRLRFECLVREPEEEP